MAVDTSGYREESTILDAAKIRGSFLDIKHIDPKKHEYTGCVSNHIILSNLKKLR